MRHSSPTIRKEIWDTMPSAAAVRHVSECFVKPAGGGSFPEVPYSPWDYALLSFHYIQKGHLFSKPTSSSFSVTSFLHHLKHSLSLTLVHFYPLAGRLVTSTTDDPPSSVVYIDCKNSPGAGLIHAAADLSIADILSPTYVPEVVQSFFDHDRAVNHDGHYRPLLTVQVTELTDGIFLGYSLNHSVGDGTSFWAFLRLWSQIFKDLKGQNEESTIFPLPEFDRKVLNLSRREYSIPYTHHDQFISRFERPYLKERFFHFSSETIAKLKGRTNSEQNTDNISSLQAVSALVWRSVTRARNVSKDDVTVCRLACNLRTRMKPAVTSNYFGNFIFALMAKTTAGELLENNLGWVASKLHETVVEANGEMARSWLESWEESPHVYQLEELVQSAAGSNGVMMGSSPRFDMYGVEFGLGKALAIRSGYANKFDGKVSLFPGRDGGGSMDLEVLLPPEIMAALEENTEFMDYAATPPHVYHLPSY